MLRALDTGKGKKMSTVAGGVGRPRPETGLLTGSPGVSRAAVGDVTLTNIRHTAFYGVFCL